MRVSVCVWANLCSHVETPILTQTCKEYHPYLIQRTGKVKYMVVQMGKKGREVQFVYDVFLMYHLIGDFTTDNI